MFIGPKEVENVQDSTSNEIKIVEVTYKDGSKEILSRLMYDATVSEAACDDTQLREKRIHPVIQQVLAVFLQWGIKLSELPYLSVVLNTSISENEKAALLALWKPWSPTVQTPDDIDLITVDRVLRNNG